jgi:hypothetical protein
MINSRRKKWTGNVTRVAEKRNVHKVLLEKLEGSGLLETSVDGKILLKWRYGRVPGRIPLSENKGSVAGCFGREPSGFIK